MKKYYDAHKKEINQLLTFLITLVAISLFVKYAMRLFAPFITAFVLSYIICMPVDFISKRTHIPRFVSTLFSMFVIITALVKVLSWLLGILSSQLLSFAASLPSSFDKAVDIFGSFRESFNSFFSFFPEEARDYFEQAISSMIPAVTAWLGEGARIFSVYTVKAIPKTFIFIIVTIVATFFMTKDKQKIVPFIERQLPDSVKKTTVILKTDIFGALWGYIRAQLVLMCFSGSIAILGLTLLKYQYSLLFGLLIACTDALPVFGPGFILWPWAAFSLLAGNYSYAAGLMVIYAAIILCRQMLEPKVLSSQIGLHPLVTLMSLYIGLMAFGPLGLIAGPVLAIITRSLQNAGLLPNWK